MVQSVRNAMSQLGYTPSSRRPGPKPFSRKGVRTGNLLLLFVGQRISGVHQLPGSPDLLRGIDMAVEDNGMKLMLAGIDGDNSIPPALDAREIDGTILFGKPDGITPAAAAKLEKLPSVAVVRGFNGLRFSMDEVGYDNSIVGGLAAQYLVGRGHRRFAFFNNNPGYPPFARRRQDFTNTAEKLGAKVLTLSTEDDRLLAGQELRYTREMVDRLLAMPERPTGLFVVADAQAAPLYHLLEVHGVKVGRDIDVISCDNSRFHRDELHPRPATIDINLELVGYRSVQQLMWRIANPNVRNQCKLMIEPVLLEGTEEAEPIQLT
jgi:LacI family transcriptional regulator